MGFWDDAENVGAGIVGGPVGLGASLVGQNAGGVGGVLQDIGLGGASSSTLAKQANLNAVGAQGQQFANQGMSGFSQLGAQGNMSLQQLQDLASGKNSVSAMQLNQGLQQNQAAQQSMAAGAAPQNAAAAARTAAIQMGRQGAGLAGQQAVAGLQERNQAQQNYASLLQGLRGQDVNAATGGLQAANQAYGGGLNGVADPTIAQQVAPIAAGFMKAI